MSIENSRRLFRASCVALIVDALTFAIRGDIMRELGSQFSLSQAQLGWVASAAFWLSTFSILLGGQLCDLLGMGRLLRAAFVGHVLGILITIFASDFSQLLVGALCIGLANGLVEATISPLVATVHSHQKTEKLNVLHAWFPGGIVLGGLIAFGLTQTALNWQVKTAVILVPTFIYGLMFLGQKFPPTERVQHGISAVGMYRESLRPSFWLFVFCMLLTASTELGPGQWIPSILTNTAHLPGILVLAWINGLMVIGRFYAGKLVERISPVTLLIFAAGLSGVGLVLLSVANSPMPTFLAATVFALGVCYFWPTMLGVTSERFPAGGALLMAIMGAAGNVSVAISLPVMGKIYDTNGPHMALRSVSLLPVVLIAIFLGVWARDRAAGGYRVTSLGAEHEP
ncbi:MAG: MFS transporter [Acidobacteriota bacterium]